MTRDSDLTNYDPIADVFLAHIARPVSWNNLYERPNMLARLPELKGKNVLDIGCSSGFYSEYALGKGASVTGIDISKVLINKLKTRLKSPVLRFFCADISQPMPFLESESFDCVICSLVIDYIERWEPLLAELYRVMKKGGKMVMATHHPFSMYISRNRYNYFAYEMIEDTWAVRSSHPFKTRYYIRPLSEVLRPIIQSGFKIISIDEPTPDEKCLELSPETYTTLSEQPGFLFFVLEK
jgi:SAM-dependent methyltransferase